MLPKFQPNRDPDHELLELAQTEAESTPENPYSSNVRRLEYWHLDHRLQVTFSNGARYEYDGVNARVWMQLKAERNRMGMAVNRILVKGPYAYRKLGQDPEEDEAAPAPEPEGTVDAHSGDGNRPKPNNRSASDRRKSRRSGPADDVRGGGQ